MSAETAVHRQLIGSKGVTLRVDFVVMKSRRQNVKLPGRILREISNKSRCLGLLLCTFGRNAVATARRDGHQQLCFLMQAIPEPPF